MVADVIASRDTSSRLEWADGPEFANRYAEVVVRTPLSRKVTSVGESSIQEDQGRLRRTFHYSIPRALLGEVRVGHLVWVPFGNRHLQGVVVGLGDVSPVEQTKDLVQLLFPEPVFTSVQIELAYWISEYYLSPLDQAIWSMFPPGIGDDPETFVELGPNAGSASARTAEQREVLGFLSRTGRASLSQLKKGLKLAKWKTALGQLVRRGVVKRWVEIGPPRVRPKVQRVVGLSHPPDDRSWEAVGRAPKQRAVLQYLAAQPAGVSMTPDSLAEAVGASSAVVMALVKKGLIEMKEVTVRRDPLSGREYGLVEAPRLTRQQSEVWNEIRRGLDGTAGVYLLHGVTGSGKTEIYLRALGRILDRGQGAIVLVPEISLTPQTIGRFASRYPGHVAVQHSRLSAGERYDEWTRVRRGVADVVIGPRSALFAPIPDLGLIVLDEEHESSYKQERTPRYHAREVAVKLRELTGATVILGSATPSLESYHSAQRGEYRLVKLPARIMGHRKQIRKIRSEFSIGRERSRVKGGETGYEDACYLELPSVQVVDLRQELRTGNRSIFSRALQDGIRAALDAGEQIILFLNRRGSATFVLCRDCGYVVRCPRCEVPLTYHGVREQLMCHHCNRRVSVPSMCPECGSRRIKFFGVGTQRVETSVKEMFPEARVVRWDRDTTGRKHGHEEMFDAFVHQEADILVGTQMIAKGLDLPLVTLVGVISADTTLNLPDFRAGERTFQLLAQVAGRAGRSILGGRVIIQTYAPLHYAVQAASRHDYESFFQQEMAFRREQWYPPFSRLVKLMYVDSSASRCREETFRMHRVLRNRIERLGLADVGIVGPAPCFFRRLRGEYRWQIILRGDRPATLLNDLPLPLGWRVDVDPVSVL